MFVISISSCEQTQRFERSISSSETSASQQDDGVSSWAKLKISPDVLGSMPYGNFRIDIYEHSSNQRIRSSTSEPAEIAKQNLFKYYYAPIVLLDNASAASYFNNFTGQFELTFRVELWNDDVQLKVTNWIKQEIDSSAKASLIQVIPFEKMILANSASTKQRYQLPKSWMPYQKQKDVRFKLICFNKFDCDELALGMRQSADQFSDLRLLFSLTSEKSQTRQTVVRVESIMSGDMATKLDQQMKSNEFALLTAEDEKRLLTESATNILIDTFDDSDVVSPNSEAQIYKLLTDHLIDHSRTVIKDQSDKMWESVFWNEDNYRPDLTSQTFNQVFNKLDTEQKKVLIKTFTDTNIVTHETSGGVPGVADAKNKIDVNLSRSGSTTNDDLEKFLKEVKETVKWTGSKFEPKPLSLARINLAKLRDTQTLKDRTVRVSYSKAVLSIAVNIPQFTDLASINRLIEIQNQIDGLCKSYFKPMAV